MLSSLILSSPPCPGLLYFLPKERGGGARREAGRRAQQAVCVGFGAQGLGLMVTQGGRRPNRWVGSAGGASEQAAEDAARVADCYMQGAGGGGADDGDVDLREYQQDECAGNDEEEEEEESEGRMQRGGRGFGEDDVCERVWRQRRRVLKVRWEMQEGVRARERGDGERERERETPYQTRLATCEFRSDE